MSNSCNIESTTGKVVRRKLQKGAKYNYDFVQVASRMVAAGMTEKDIGYWLGVKPTTISQYYELLSKTHADITDYAVSIINTIRTGCWA